MAILQEEKISEIIRQVLNECNEEGTLAAGQLPSGEDGVTGMPTEMRNPRVKIGISNHHIHLDHHDLEILFGKGHELAVKKPLSQEGMFAAEEQVILAGPRGCLTGVRVLGPLRKNTQVEIAFTDARHLGIRPPVMQSGSVGSTPELTIVGPCGSITNHNAIMVAQRHIHLETQQALKWNLHDGDIVRARAGTVRSVVFENVVVRTGDGWVNEFHIDTDEGNSADLKTGDFAEILR